MQTILSHYNHTHAVWLLSLSIILGAFMYVSLVSAATLNVAERLDLEKEVATLRAETSQLEFTSIALSQQIDIEEAFALGFIETDTPHYVVRGGSGAFALSN